MSSSAGRNYLMPVFLLDLSPSTSYLIIKIDRTTDGRCAMVNTKLSILPRCLGLSEVDELQGISSGITFIHAVR